MPKSRYGKQRRNCVTEGWSTGYKRCRRSKAKKKGRKR